MLSSGIEALGTNYSGSGAYRGVNGEFSKNAFGNSSGFKAVMIASGGLSGGLSSAIAGGSFWKGVREGLITAGLNHAMHSMLDGGGEGDPKKTGERIRKGKNGGEVHNLFDESDEFYDWPDEMKTEKNTIKIVGHGNAKRAGGMDAEQLHNYLLNNSELYCTSFMEGTTIIVKLYSCLTAGITYGSHLLEGNNIATDLSLLNKNATIIAPTKSINRFGIRGDGFMASIRNGKFTAASMNFFCERQTKMFTVFDSYTAKNINIKFFQLKF